MGEREGEREGQREGGESMCNFTGLYRECIIVICFIVTCAFHVCSCRDLE